MNLEDEADRSGFPMRVAARLSGVSPERIRAWETRHAAIRPARSEGGSRRYSHADLERLRLLKQVVDSGRRISEVAKLDLSSLRSCLAESAEGVEGEGNFAELLAAIEALDADRVKALVADRIDSLGVIEFARGEALEVLFEVGRLWRDGRLSVAAEHMASAIIRSTLLSQIESSADDDFVRSPRILFATPPKELHDIGLLVAALVARDLRAQPIFLGADVPVDDLVASVRITRVDVLAISLVTLPASEAEQALVALRKELPRATGLWVGGAGIHGLPPIRGIDRVSNLDQLAAFVHERRGAFGRADSRSVA